MSKHENDHNSMSVLLIINGINIKHEELKFEKITETVHMMCTNFR